MNFSLVIYVTAPCNGLFPEQPSISPAVHEDTPNCSYFVEVAVNSSISVKILDISSGGYNLDIHGDDVNILNNTGEIYDRYCRL